MLLFIGMKIVVTTLRSSKGDEHQIDVVDGSKILHTQIVKTIEQRDKTIWDLQEMYNVVDIDIKTTKGQVKHKKEEFRYTEIPNIPVLDESEAAEFFDSESAFVFERIVKAIEEGLLMKLTTIRLFELNGTGKYLTADRPDWKQGLQRALDYFLSREMYLNCARVRDLMKKI